MKTVAGRLTSRSGVAGAAGYQWDATSSLVASSGAGGDRVYVYDASGQRVAQVKVTDLTSSATALESTVYVGSVEATDAQPASVGGVSAQRFVSFGGATVAVESRTATGVTSWSLVLGDVQGSAQVMVELVPGATTTGWEDYDSNNHGVSRSAYTPFGATRVDGLDINRGWLGQVEDEGTGLTYLNARYYDPATMRFISPDPLMNPGDPRTLDPYKYANNNPVAYTDASGLEAVCSKLRGKASSACQNKEAAAAIALNAKRYDQGKAGSRPPTQRDLKNFMYFQRTAEALDGMSSVSGANLALKWLLPDLSKGNDVNNYHDGDFITGALLRSDVFRQDGKSTIYGVLALLDESGELQIGVTSKKFTYNHHYDEKWYQKIVPALEDLVAGVLMSETDRADHARTALGSYDFTVTPVARVDRNVVVRIDVTTTTSVASLTGYAIPERTPDTDKIINDQWDEIGPGMFGIADEEVQTVTFYAMYSIGQA